MKENKIFYYKSFKDDFIINKNQEYKLPKDYKWIHNNFFYKMFSSILYKIFRFMGFIYCKLFLHVKIQNKEVLKKYKKQGYFIYGNHTQPIGDVFIPAITSSKRIYTIASPSNLGVSVIGPLLPMIGILPIPDDLARTKDLYNAVKTRVKEKNAIIIYPEAHVWPYYTKIRPYRNTSFKFPVDTNSVSFCMTTTYYKRRNRKKPGIKVYIDGPFEIDNNLNKNENKEKLCNNIYECMQKRAKESSYEYIEYREENK